MIEVRNFTRSFKEDNLIKKTAKEVLRGEERENTIISIALVGEARMRKLNKDYRKKDKPTDVLSFPTKDNFIIKERELGEIVICPRWIKRQKEDLRRVIIHGILHLLDYNHEKKEDEIIMRKREEHYLF